MDPRRLLTLCLAAVSLGGCALLRTPAVRTTAPAPLAAAVLPDAAVPAAAPLADAPRAFATMAPIPNPGPSRRPTAASRHPPTPPISRPVSDKAGREAILVANRQARAPSRAQNFQGGLQVFAYEPGRVFEVWTAPLRVTTLTLAPGEKVIAKAAGDTVRWQIGETVSGDGTTQRAHVMIKPLTRGLETNLALTTNRRLYLLQLRSGPPAAFNAAVAWDVAAALDLPDEWGAATAPPPEPPVGPGLDARFAIRPKGKRPAWTPAAVMTDGIRTYLRFPAHAAAAESPALFAMDPSGAIQMVNYRQQSGLWVVDRVLERAELRLGGRHPQVVRIERLGGAP